MIKVKYVLLPMDELKRKISKYIGTDDYNLKMEGQEDENAIIKNNCGLILSIPKKEKEKTLVLLKKITNSDNQYLTNDIDWNCEFDIILNMTDCSYMLSKIFDITEKVSFYDEAILVNKDKNVYLYYK